MKIKKIKKNVFLSKDPEAPEHDVEHPAEDNDVEHPAEDNDGEHPAEDETEHDNVIGHEPAAHNPAEEVQEDDGDGNLFDSGEEVEGVEDVVDAGLDAGDVADVDEVAADTDDRSASSVSPSSSGAQADVFRIKLPC